MTSPSPTVKPTVGIALGSGASRGWAHIGAIEALEEEGIAVGCIAGCSVGAYVGAVHAGGGMKSLKDFVLKMDGRKVFSYFDVVFPRSGLLNGSRRVRELFSMHTIAERFSDLSIPTAIVATDLFRGDRVVLRSGDLIEALCATMSVPGLFAPCRIKERWCVDGGLVDPVPVGVARSMGADVVIAVDLNSGSKSRKRLRRQTESETTEEQDSTPAMAGELRRKLAAFYETTGSGWKEKVDDFFGRDPERPDILETVMASIHIVQDRITRINLAVDPPDVLLQPRLGELKMLDFDQVAHVIEEGYLSARENMDDIKAALGR